MSLKEACEAPAASESSCLSSRDFREALSQNALGVDVRIVLAHFGRHCRNCWRQLDTLCLGTVEEMVRIDLRSLVEAAARVEEPPVLLVLGRLLAFSRGTGEEAALAPTHRHLLRRARWQGFAFRWLLIEEVRSLALGFPGRGVARWLALGRALDAVFGNVPDPDEELRVVRCAYRADELMAEGDPRAAEQLLDRALEDRDVCRPAIRAVLYEIRSDLDRRLGRPYQALSALGYAERSLAEVDIPGRLAEILTKKAYALLLADEPELARIVFDEALRAIPVATDPRLRAEIYLHRAGMEARAENFTAMRYFLTQAAPLLAASASSLMKAQSLWLWGLLYRHAGELEKAERCLRQALAGHACFGPLLAQARILLELGQVYAVQGKKADRDRMALELARLLRRPELRAAALEAVEEILRDARACGLRVPELDEPERVH